MDRIVDIRVRVPGDYASVTYAVQMEARRSNGACSHIPLTVIGITHVPEPPNRTAEGIAAGQDDARTAIDRISTDQMVRMYLHEVIDRIDALEGAAKVAAVCDPIIKEDIVERVKRIEDERLGDRMAVLERETNKRMDGLVNEYGAAHPNATRRWLLNLIKHLGLEVGDFGIMQPAGEAAKREHEAAVAKALRTLKDGGYTVYERADIVAPPPTGKIAAELTAADFAAMAGKRTIKGGWLNIFETNAGDGTFWLRTSNGPWLDRGQANLHGGGRIACIRVPDFAEGEGL